MNENREYFINQPLVYKPCSLPRYLERKFYVYIYIYEPLACMSKNEHYKPEKKDPRRDSSS